jgi:hypothetical protein
MDDRYRLCPSGPRTLIAPLRRGSRYPLRPIHTQGYPRDGRKRRRHTWAWDRLSVIRHVHDEASGSLFGCLSHCCRHAEYVSTFGPWLCRTVRTECSVQHVVYFRLVTSDNEHHIKGVVSSRHVTTMQPSFYIAKRRCLLGPLVEAESDTEAVRSHSLKLGYLCGICGALCHTIRRRWRVPADVDGRRVEHH